MQELIDILKRRIDPTGTREVTIREVRPGHRNHHPEHRPGCARVRQASDHGNGSARVPDHGRSHPAQSAGTRDHPAGTRTVAGPKRSPRRRRTSWPNGSPTRPDEFGPPIRKIPMDGTSSSDMAGDMPEALVLIEPDSVSVTGDYLSSVSQGRRRTRRTGRQFHVQHCAAPSLPTAYQQEHCRIRRPEPGASWASCSTSDCFPRPSIEINDLQPAARSAAAIWRRRSRLHRVDPAGRRAAAAVGQGADQRADHQPDARRHDDRKRQAGNSGFARRDHRVHVGLLPLCRFGRLLWRWRSTCCWWWP